MAHNDYLLLYGGEVIPASARGRRSDGPRRRAFDNECVWSVAACSWVEREVSTGLQKKLVAGNCIQKRRSFRNHVHQGCRRPVLM